MRAMRTRTILLASLMIMMSMTPLVSADYEKGIEEGKEFDESPIFDLPAKTIESVGPRIDTGASGRPNVRASKFSDTTTFRWYLEATLYILIKSKSKPLRALQRKDFCS